MRGAPWNVNDCANCPAACGRAQAVVAVVGVVAAVVAVVAVAVVVAAVVGSGFASWADDELLQPAARRVTAATTVTTVTRIAAVPRRRRIS